MQFKGASNINEESSSRVHVKTTLKLMAIATNAWGSLTATLLGHQTQFLSSVAQGGEDGKEL